jgi:hypothetical protein
MTTFPHKPLGIKNYGHIPHLPGSRIGPGDHHCDAGQARIATLAARDRHDRVIVLEKLDGSNVGVARVGGMLYALNRSGYEAMSSPYEQHRLFAHWVYENQDRFLAVLHDGERLGGEWLAQVHGTRYALPHEPFVAFDLMVGMRRRPFEELVERAAAGGLTTPTVLHRGGPLAIGEALARLGEHGFHGALDRVEGAVWRIERNELVCPGRGGERRQVVDFLVKYVRPEKVDGCYLPEITGSEPHWNWRSGRTG